MSEKTVVYVAGHQGMVGSSICRLLSQDQGVDLITNTRSELDLTNQALVKDFFATTKVDQIYLGAARVGGIHANNTYPAEFIYDNLMIEANIIHAAFKAGVKRIMFLGSSCIYPKMAEQPMVEEALLTGSLEPTNEPYAIAKIAGIKMCDSYNRQYGESHGVDYRCIMPTNLYGPCDNYHPDNSHVIPGLLQRIHDAKFRRKAEVSVWGTGRALREFLYVDDLAKACVTLMGVSEQSIKSVSYNRVFNVGSGNEVSIKELAELVSEIIGYEGDIRFDASKPDGSPRKLLDSSKIHRIGWRPTVTLREGLAQTYQDYLRCT